MDFQSTTPRPFAFVLMPFSEGFDDVYHLGIKPACESAGVYAERVDEQLFQESIISRIYNQIVKADVIVADMTGRNPNVFYETGYAHALGKRVILITQETSDIPFDLKHHPHIVYGGRITSLIPELTRRVKWAITEPGGAALRLSQQIHFYIDGKALSRRPTIKTDPIYEIGGSSIKMKIDAQNSGEFLIKSCDFRIGIVTSARFSRIHDYRGLGLTYNVIKIQKDRFLHLPEKEFHITPGYWESAIVELSVRQAAYNGDRETLTLRMFTEDDVRDFDFEMLFDDGGLSGGAMNSPAQKFP